MEGFRKTYRYYLLYRGRGPGCQPNGFVAAQDFDHKQYVDEIGRWAFGWVEYDWPLTEKEISEYELAGVKE
jgi:hypothetical protein